MNHVFEEGELSKDTTVSKMEIVVNRVLICTGNEIPHYREKYVFCDKPFRPFVLSVPQTRLFITIQRQVH